MLFKVGILLKIMIIVKLLELLMFRVQRLLFTNKALLLLEGLLIYRIMDREWLLEILIIVMLKELIINDFNYFLLKILKIFNFLIFWLFNEFLQSMDKWPIFLHFKQKISSIFFFVFLLIFHFFNKFFIFNLFY